MADYQSLIDKLDSEASARDANGAKEKCPAKKKPALFVMVARAEDNEALSGIKVDVSKPTAQNKTTDGNGIAKFDPAQLGAHGIKVVLDATQEKTYAAPGPSNASVTAGKTRTHLIMVPRVPSFQVTLLRTGDKQPIEGATIELSGPESLNAQTAARSGIATFNRLKPGQYEVKVTLSQQLALSYVQPDPLRKTVAAGRQNLMEILLDVRAKITPNKREYTVVLTKAGAEHASHPLLGFSLEGPPGWLFDVQLSRHQANALTGGPGLAGAWDSTKPAADRVVQSLFSSWTNGQKTLKFDAGGKATYKMPLDWWKDQARRKRTDFTTEQFYYRVLVFPDAAAAFIARSIRDGQTPPNVTLRNNLTNFQFTNSGYVLDVPGNKAKNPVSFKYTVREANTADMYTFVQWKKGFAKYTTGGVDTYGTVKDYGIRHRANMTEWSIDRLETNPRYHNGPTISADGKQGSSEDAPTLNMRDEVATRNYDFDTRVHLDCDVPAAVTITKQVGAGEPYDEVIGKLADPQPLILDNHLWTCSMVLTEQPDGSYLMTNP